jgi:DNA-binding NarL/FixJ family response regulator
MTMRSAPVEVLLVKDNQPDVLTTSQADQDVLRSYRLRANAYVTKPVDLDRFLTVVRSIEHFWLEIVKLSRP